MTSVAQGGVVTLTASVTSGASTLTTGQVSFCDTAGVLCTDIHRLGIAQLTVAGTATLRFRPASGTHTYRAAFGGTQTVAPSVSAVASLSVNGPSLAAGAYTTVTSLTQFGTYTNYTLTATVTAKAPASLTGLTGGVSFRDTTHGNTVLASAIPGATTASVNFVTASTPAAVAGSKRRRHS